ncbi:MAG: hypothetical protein ACRYFA_08420 [Janthinobacterium lividum]
MNDKSKKDTSFLLFLLIVSVIIGTIFSGFAKNMVTRTGNKPIYLIGNTQDKR